jgi:hypothetical protein
VSGSAKTFVRNLFHSRDDSGRFVIGELGEKVLHGPPSGSCSIVAPLSPSPVLKISHGGILGVFVALVG